MKKKKKFNEFFFFFCKTKGRLDELIQDLEDSKRSIQSMKNDFLRISHVNNEQDNEMSRFFLDEISRLSKDLRNSNNIQTEETNFLKKQVNMLNQDRIKLTQNILILENRVIENEKDVGFKNVYDA